MPQYARWDQTHRLSAPHANIPLRDIETLLRLLTADEPDSHRLIEHLTAAAGLSRAVLAYANGAIHGLAHPIRRISHAVALLGQTRLRAFAERLASRQLRDVPTD